MGLTAVLTPLGKNHIPGWASEDDQSHRELCEKEENLLRELEKKLEEQLGRPVTLVNTILDGSLPPRGKEDTEEEKFSCDVSNGYGLELYQFFLHSVILEKKCPPLRRNENPSMYPRFMKDPEKREVFREFIHLADHSTLNGYYIPVEFPEPIWLAGEIVEEHDDFTAGSSQNLLRELEKFKTLAEKCPDFFELYKGEISRFILMCQFSVESGLAIELV